MSADPLDDASQHEQEMRDDGIADHTAFVPARLHVAAVRIPVIATHVTPRIRTALTYNW